ncbi:MAG: hypothetical protein AAB426_09595 [Myxococcota bacterium]
MPARVAAPPPLSPAPWWQERRRQLLAMMRDEVPRYVYHLPTVRQRALVLRDALDPIDTLFYSMKANGHEEILRTVARARLGIECVSLPEVERVRRVLGPKVAVLFTPNFCPLAEYARALELGAEVVVDGPEPLRALPHVFRHRDIGVRIDPGRGQGHHAKVRTAGATAKFGHPLEQAGELASAAAAVGARVIGLHAHIGSGILDARAWTRTARTLLPLRSVFPHVRWMSLGGGLGIAYRPERASLDLAALGRSLATLSRRNAELDLRLEPGRFLVAEAGVLLAPVTQVRRKGRVTFVGIATGMNSLLRPALYAAWHGIHNLTRLGEPNSRRVDVVGPLCESGDVLGRDRDLPETVPGDILLIEHTGAYGAVMSSHYNLRPPAVEVVLRR